MRLLLMLLLAVMSPGLVMADEQVRVFKVFDGDTVLVRTRTNSQRVQLAGIDAPELDQPGGLGSLAVLQKMIGRKRVLIQVVGENTVGDPLVRMFWSSKYDIALEMVRAGAAWVSPDGSQELRDAQTQARQAGLGIWASDMPEAVAPWQWRNEHQEGR